jgi:citrate lyase subunit beta/citryl-CoA lyase
VLTASAGQGGVFRFRGRMVDAPVLAHAREVLRQAGG